MSCKEWLISELWKSKPMVKSKFLKIIKSKFWKGYLEPDFVSKSKEIDSAFNELVSEGKIIYEKGQNLLIYQASKNKIKTVKTTGVQIVYQVKITCPHCGWVTGHTSTEKTIKLKVICEGCHEEYKVEDKIK